ncbi:MAG: phosphoadenylyl-sulfate reductase [Acidimicrobiia bacterium]|nr:phosphoadenylyl-sulfate reductase [Acidimicrobiia bacterium]
MLPPDVAARGDELTRMDPGALLAWAAERFSGGIVCLSALGAEDCVLVDVIARGTLPIPIVTIDTAVLFRETYALWSRLERRYGIEIAGIRSDLIPDGGPTDPSIDRLWERDPDACCRERKIVPLRRELGGRQAWITGIRREQSEARRHAQPVEWDAAFGLVKVNPLVTWTAADVRAYLTAHDVPYNPLHDRGYPSIGCEPCTSPAAEGEDGRAGRWRGREKSECGLHVAPATLVGREP